MDMSTLGILRAREEMKTSFSNTHFHKALIIEPVQILNKQKNHQLTHDPVVLKKAINSNVAMPRDIGMKDPGDKSHLGRFERISKGDF